MKSTDKEWTSLLDRLYSLPNETLFNLIKNDLKIVKSFDKNNFTNSNFDDSEKYLICIGIMTEYDAKTIKNRLKNL